MKANTDTAIDRLEKAICLILAGAKINESGHKNYAGRYMTEVDLKLTPEIEDRAVLIAKNR